MDCNDICYDSWYQSINSHDFVDPHIINRNYHVQYTDHFARYKLISSSALFTLENVAHLGPIHYQCALSTCYALFIL